MYIFTPQYYRNIGHGVHPIKIKIWIMNMKYEFKIVVRMLHYVSKTILNVNFWYRIVTIKMISCKTILILMRKWFGLKTLQYQQSLEKIVWLFLVQNHYNTKWFGAKTVNNLVQKRYKEILVKTRIIFFENLFRRRYYFHSLPTIFVIIGDKVQDWIGKRLMNLFKSYTLISLFLAHENFIMQNAFRV